jgi:hypothetical protein
MQGARKPKLVCANANQCSYLTLIQAEDGEIYEDRKRYRNKRQCNAMRFKFPENTSLQNESGFCGVQ